jgi:hypothetical protein
MLLERQRRPLVTVGVQVTERLAPAMVVSSNNASIGRWPSSSSSSSAPTSTDESLSTLCASRRAT